MIKSELILRIAEQNPHLREKDVEAVVNAILGRITDALVAGNRVELRGFGILAVKVYEARAGRNPRTGAAIAVSEKRVLAFKPAKAMKARLIDPEAHRPAALKGDTQWQSRSLGRGPSVR
jgi:integration host factor subunit beta